MAVENKSVLSKLFLYIIGYNWIIIPVFLLSQVTILSGALMPLKGKAAAKLFSGPMPHFLAFFTTTLLVCIILSNFGIKFYYFLAFIYSMGVATFVEYLQEYLTSYRTFSTTDIMYGAFGAFCLVLLDRVFFLLRKK